MISDAVRIERERTKRERALASMSLTRSIIDNPVVEFAAFIAGLELWYRYKKSRPGIDQTALGIDSLLLFTTGSAIIAAHQIAPVMPDLLRGGSSATASLGPLLAAAVPK